MKIATWNVNSLKVRLPHVLQWLEDNPVDVLCLQETKLTDDKFPVMEIGAAGYQVAFTGRRRYSFKKTGNGYRQKQSAFPG